jgi:hypothetical protein
LFTSKDYAHDAADKAQTDFKAVIITIGRTALFEP